MAYKGSAYERFALHYQETLARSRITLTLHETDGAADNLALLKTPDSGVDVALFFGGLTNSEKSPDLMSLGRISYAPIWIFYRGTETLERLTQFKGKRIAEPPASRRVIDPILAAHGVNPGNTTVLPLTAIAAAKALKDGEADVFVLISELSAALVQTMLRDPTVRLMSVTQSEAITRVYPFLTRLVLPQGVIDFEKNTPAADVILLADTHAVVVRKDLHPELVYLLAQAMSEEHSAAGVFQRAGDFPTTTDPEFPVAQSALDFYKSGVPFLNRYLPGWIVPHAQRLFALLLATGAIAFPLFSFAPKLPRSLVEFRLRSLYRRMRAIDASLQKDVPVQELAELESELQSVDRAIDYLRLPMQHSDLYFAIESHLEVVRARIRLRHAGSRNAISVNG